MREWESKNMTNNMRELLRILQIDDPKSLEKLKKNREIRKILRQELEDPTQFAVFLQTYTEISPGAAIAFARRLQEHFSEREKSDPNTWDEKDYSIHALLFLLFEQNNVISGMVRGIGRVGVEYADEAIVSILFAPPMLRILLDMRDKKLQKLKKNKS